MNLKQILQPIFLFSLVFSSFPVFSATPPALSNPSATPESALGPVYYGELNGGATVSAGGNASYIIPIEVPPGIRGMAPAISLNYNSNMKNGLLGLGWFMQGGSSKISRCPRIFAIDSETSGVEYTTDDRFCMDGNRLLVVNGGSYGSSGTEYRTETDKFSRIISYGTAGSGPAYFTVETKGGQTKYYGNTTDSRIEAEGRTDVRSWALNRVEDLMGNYYSVSYHEDNAEGEFYPTQVDYTGNDPLGLTPNAQVEFNYEARSDNQVKFVANSQWRPHPKRLKSIKTYVNSALVRSYTLSYDEVGYGSLSRMTQIEHCDAQGNCQEPTQLTWQSPDGIPSYGNTTIQTPWYSQTVCDNSGQTSHPGKRAQRWHDFNGDGKADYIHPNYVLSWDNRLYSQHSQNLSFTIMLSTPSGYVEQTWTTSIGAYLGDIMFGDINGDGMTDIAFKDRTTRSGSSPKIDVALSTGTSFDNQLWDGHATNYYRYQEYSLQDVDGDGLPDLISLTPKSNSRGSNRDMWVRLNTGSSFGPESLWKGNKSMPIDLKDMNGDGRADMIRNGKVYLSDGTEFGASLNWDGTDEYADYNGDGLPDMLKEDSSFDYWVHLNTGTGFQQYAKTTKSPSADIDNNGLFDSDELNFNYYTGKGTLNILFNEGVSGAPGNLEWNFTDQTLYSSQYGRNLYRDWVDINGDGQLDYTGKTTSVCYSTGAGSYGYWREQSTMVIKKSNQGAPNLLRKVTTGLGAEVEFTYKPLADSSVYTKGSGAQFPKKDVQDSTHVVSHLQQSDGIGGFFESDYLYEGLVRDYHGRGNLGFAKITAINVDRGTTTSTEYSQEFPHASQPTKTEVRRTSDNQLLSSVDTTYAVHGTIGSGPVFPYVDERVAKTFNLADVQLMSTSTTENQSDAYGNITDTSTTVIDAYSNQTFKNQTLSTFAVDVASWRVAQQTSQTVKQWLDGVNLPAFDRTTASTYDATTGLPASSTREPGGGAGIELTTTIARDGFGNVLSETVSGPGVTSRVNSTTYDANGQFPLTVTNAMGHQNSFTWIKSFGKKLSATEANGQTASWTYNGLGQETLETRPDGTTSQTTMYKDNSSGFTTGFYLETLASGKAPARQFMDVLGRPIRTRSQSFTGYYINHDTEYDSQGRAYRSSEPYFDGDTPEWNTNTYDDIGRVTALAAADPVKSTTVSYDAFSVSVSDALWRTTTKQSNAAGQVIAVQDDAGTNMTMVYDPAGNRIQVINADGDALQSTVTYSYDRLGRLLIQNDPDHGIYTYTYDALGQKLSEISPKLAAASQSIFYQYDLLGRMTSRTEPEGTTNWTYDNTTGGNLGVGQLASESQSGYSRSYAYGSGNYGRLTSSTSAIGSSAYTTSLTYDALGRIATQQYPSGANNFNVEYTYNALGYQERVQALGGSVFYQLLDTDASGRVSVEWMGDGSTSTKSYAANSDRLTDQQSSIGALDIQHFSYSYDSAGSMTSRGDLVHSLTESFTFDNLDRMTSAQVAGATAATYGFDVVGNITEKSDVGDPYLYTSAAVHAVTQITAGATTQSLSYDSNGNLANGTDVPTITWSSYNKPTQLTKGSNTYTFAYGPDRKRYKKTHNGDTTTYVGGNFEIIDKPGTIEYRSIVRANGKAIMLRKTSTTSSNKHEYIHRDHLGSVTAIVRQSGLIVERSSYDAWGKRRSAADWTSAATTAYEQRGYTGHEHLDDIGIIHMNGRVYDPKLGRMLSPDPVTQAPENGQNYNRYSYVFNNPLKYTDPSGYNGVNCTIFDFFCATGVPQWDGTPGFTVGSNSGVGGGGSYDTGGWNTLFSFIHAQVERQDQGRPLQTAEEWLVEQVGDNGAVTVKNPVVGAALDYLGNSQTFNEIYAQTNAAGVTIKTVTTPGFVSTFDYETNSVLWNPTQANRAQNGVISPAVILGHELAHAARFNENPELFLEELHSPVVRNPFLPPGVGETFGTSPEEARATSVEQQISLELGEPVRVNYRDAKDVYVTSPTFSCFEGLPGCANF